MTALQIARIARDIVPPVGATGVVAIVDVEPCGRLTNGYPSGVVSLADGAHRWPRTRYGVAWLIGDRVVSAPIAMFDRPADAQALHRLLAGEQPAPRPGQAEPTHNREALGLESDPDRIPAPDEPLATGARTCAGCGLPLPAGARSNQRTCDRRCRQRAAYRDGGARAGADADSAEAIPTLSRPSDAVPALTGAGRSVPADAGRSEGSAPAMAGLQISLPAPA